MAHHVSSEAIETYLHKKTSYPLDVIGDRGKKASFSKDRKPFSMLHGELTYNNTKLVISSRERQHIIIGNIHKD